MEVMLEQLGTSVDKSFLEQGKSLLDMVLLKSSCHLGGVRPGFHSCRVGHLRGGRCRSASKKGSSQRGMGAGAHGADARQDSSKEDGAAARQGLFEERWMKVCREDQAPSEEEDQSDQVQSSKENSREKEDGPAGQQDQGGQSRPMIVHGMQSMQEMMLRSKEEGSDEPEVARVAPQLPRLPECSAASAPIDFNDWLTCLEVHMCDLTMS